MSSFYSNNSSNELSYYDFDINQIHLQEGGWGKVFSANYKKNNTKVALKFFGYTKQRPIISEILKEINLMKSLVGVEGVVQIYGTFNDSSSGYMPNKTIGFHNEYPVIVMEMLEGGDLFERISTRSTVSEGDLAFSFRSAMEALQSIHNRGFIHRDLKLDNLMNISRNEGTKIKLIDFGFMISIPPTGVVRSNGNLIGTEGWFAPESITNFEYSKKTDIWQAGCILYTMLAGHPPFHSNPKYRYQITRLTYSPMKGAAWDHISDSAKDLVDNMLKKNPNERYSMNQVLNHPWLRSAASDVAFNDEYIRRIKNLSLRSKLKRAFLAHNTAEHQNLRDNFQNIFPFLRPFQQFDELHSLSQEGFQELQAQTRDFHQRLLKLKENLVNEILNSSNEIIDQNEPAHKRRRFAHPGYINFELFCQVVTQVGLDALASEDIFNIFDTDGSGTIDMKEFLITLVALRPSYDESDEIEAAKLYFSVFDIDEDGYIGVDELELVIHCFLHDGVGPLLVTSDTDVNSYNVQEMFQHIDTNNDGRIDFNEFKDFYIAVLLPSSIQPSSIHDLSMIEQGGY